MKNDSFVIFFYPIFFTLLIRQTNFANSLTKDFIRDINYSQCVLNDIAFTNETNH